MIGRRAFLGAPLAAIVRPRRHRKRRHMTQPWSNQAVSLIILEASPGTFTGLFMYSPAPGAGKLVASIAAANGTDVPYGNAYDGPGFATYAGQGANQLVSVLKAGALNLSTNSLINTSQSATVASDSSGQHLVLQSGSTGIDGTEIQQTLGTIFVQSQGIGVTDPLMDIQGNLRIEGLLELPNQATPLPLAANAEAYATAGHQKYVSPDGSDYNTGRSTHPASGPLTVGTSMATVPGCTAPMAAGSNYRVRGQALINVPGTAGQGALSYRLQGTGGLVASGGRTSIIETFTSNGIGVADFATLGTTLTGSTPGGGGANRVVQFDGYFEISTGGTIALQVAQAATAAVTVVQFGSYLEVMPVT